MAEITFVNYLEERFRAFIAAAHDGRVPYQWQIRTMRMIAEHGRWPDRIVAPTASGKTCVIDIHVFLNAMAGLQEDKQSPEDMHNDANEPSLQKLPRRLALTVNRRSLVDDQYEEALALQRRILDSDKDDALYEFRCGLESRAGAGKDALPKIEDDQRALSTLIAVELRGGLGSNAQRREWRYYPQTCAVICATPDMFGSRLLFRGYGTSRAMRPMEAGELAYDTVLVADEAHLSRQLLETARQVSRIESFSSDDTVRSCVSPLQVVETTATPSSAEDHADDIISVGVESADFTVDTDLARRLGASYSVDDSGVLERCSKRITVDCSALKEQEKINNIVDCCEELIANHADQTADGLPNIVGCVVNTVSTAQKVKKELEKRLKGDESKGTIQSYVGPMRPYDKEQVAASFHDTFAEKSSAQAPCCIIGTQTLEVGVDVDFADMVTELAPASALAQRAGRVNRRGLRELSHIYVYGLSDKASSTDREKNARPYTVEELDESRKWIDKLPVLEDDHEFSAWAIREAEERGNPVPVSKPSRLLYQRLESWDVENLSHTDEDLFADCSIGELQQTPSDINLWLRDSLDQDIAPSVGIVVRDLPWDDAVAAELIGLAAPMDSEIFPVRSWAQLSNRTNSLRSYLEENEDEYQPIRMQNAIGEIELHHRRIFRYRASANASARVAVFTNQQEFDISQSGCVEPGDVFIVDSYAPLFSDAEYPVFDPKDKGGSPTEDVLNRCNGDWNGMDKASQSIKQQDLVVVRVDRTVRNSASEAAENLRMQLDDIQQYMEQGRVSSEKLDEKQREIPSLIQRLLNAIMQSQSQAANELTMADYLVDDGEHETEHVDTVTYAKRHSLSCHDVYWFALRSDAALTGNELSQESSSVRQKDVDLHGVDLHGVDLHGPEGHQRYVANRAQAIAEQIGLRELESLFFRAGLYHDEGKKDKRFQNLLQHGELENSGDDKVLAKSGFSSWKGERQFREANQLRGWRHEQRSVAEFLTARDNGEIESVVCETESAVELVERLIGTSHGHGRSSFKHATDFLLPQQYGEPSEEQQERREQLLKHSRELFDQGGWESLIDRTNHRYGFWGMAYLESLLRAADITVSKEGR
ncbi:type I-G CRISPR-associated helicase/endonuclease Cas3g [Bifidobacterium eulemuris]|uniref:Type I-U CRISPR-associated helicase/endonuclease Cas3 n=1 Tax=Bifidobacterium eulemuris TaxID=1765219 RepID=A0A261G0Y7_9BIFI|nr:type I-U CRISPR-associated helicase/endonuclease Cas3 [Bifidobacterium eulemuris]OZG65048.1 hypothetical protein BEUL_2058 [Bifidobacterium eulemuris]QOL32865.1 type I-U CRISPR-associated helicase/endonuclease Cas3 [Bifidobacterium eulemuris]